MKQPISSGSLNEQNTPMYNRVHSSELELHSKALGWIATKCFWYVSVPLILNFSSFLSIFHLSPLYSPCWHWQITDVPQLQYYANCASWVWLGSYTARSSVHGLTLGKQERRVSEIVNEEGGSEDRLFTFSQEAGVRGHPRKLSFQQVYRKQKEVLTHAAPR